MNLDPLDEYMEEVYNRKINNAKQEGELIGLEKGELIGLEKGELIGLEKGELKTEEAVNKSTLEIAKEMIKNKCTKDQVINSTKITEKQFLALLKV